MRLYTVVTLCLRWPCNPHQCLLCPKAAMQSPEVLARLDSRFTFWWQSQGPSRFCKLPAPNPLIVTRILICFFLVPKLIFTDSRSTSIVGGWPTWHTPLQPDAKERYSDGRLHQRNGCRSWLKKSETNILLVPDPPPQTKLGKCVITKQGFLDTLYILTFFALVFWEGKARQASKRDAWAHQKHKTIMLGPISIFWLILYRIIYCVWTIFVKLFSAPKQTTPSP